MLGSARRIYTIVSIAFSRFPLDLRDQRENRQKSRGIPEQHTNRRSFDRLGDVYSKVRLGVAVRCQTLTALAKAHQTMLKLARSSLGYSRPEVANDVNH